MDVKWKLDPPQCFRVVRLEEDDDKRRVESEMGRILSENIHGAEVSVHVLAPLVFALT